MVTGGAFNGPKSVVYTDSVTNETKYSLWIGGSVLIADSVDGPFVKLENFSYPGGNPAPLWHNDAFYCTARCAVLHRNLLSRMPLDPTHVRLKGTCV